MHVNRDAEWLTEVGGVERPRKGWWNIGTFIVDPGGDSGSPEASRAEAICDAAVSLLTRRGAMNPRVQVFDSEGKRFVVFGHPKHDLDYCTEV